MTNPDNIYFTDIVYSKPQADDLQDYTEMIRKLAVPHLENREAVKAKARIDTDTGKILEIEMEV